MAGIRYNDGYRIHRDNTDIVLWLFLSIALHAILATAAVFSPSPSKKILYSPVYEVDLVSAPVAPKVEPQPLPVPEEVKPVEKPKPETVRKSGRKVRAAAVPRTKSAPVKSDDAISKLREKFAAEEAVDRLRKKVQEKEASGGRAGVRIAQRAPSRVYQYEELNAELKAYFDRIHKAIRESWSLPAGLSNKGFKTVLSIHVLRDGTIESLWIEQGSGNRYYDESAIRAINKITPLPPLPKGWKDNYIDLGLNLGN